MEVQFNRIYIFDLEKEVAYTTAFKRGVNVVTSDAQTGTDRGKSVLLRSLYHSLGADTYHAKTWNLKTKVYILEFQIGEVKYIIYRANRLYKIFNNSKEKIDSTTSSKELAEILGKLWNFQIYLPSKKTQKMEVAPVVYSYLFNFIDQDHYNYSKFDSFDHLTQYSNFKETLILTTLGIYDKKYFENLRKKEKERINIEKITSSLDTNEKLRRKTDIILEGIICPGNIEGLREELEVSLIEYRKITNKMNELRTKLLDCKSKEYNLEKSLIDLNETKNQNNKEIKKIRKSNTCPECRQVLDDDFQLISSKYNLIENEIILQSVIEEDLGKLKREISKYEEIYLNYSEKLKKYNEYLTKGQESLNSYVKHRGVMELRENLNIELIFYEEKRREAEEIIAKINKILKQVITKKKAVNERYYKIFKAKKEKAKLGDLEDNDINKITSNFITGGSNKPLSTLMWYLTLNKLKKEFNSEAVQFPMVLDSPKNAELDGDKSKMIIDFILESSDLFNQIIISSIGFEKTDKQVNVIKLTNEKYELLDKKTYEENKEILDFYASK